MSQSAPPLVDPNDLGHGPLVMGFTWTFTAIAIFAVTLRVYIRHTVVKRISIDDWLMCLALAFHLVSASFVTIGYHYGLGKHDASLTPTEMMNVLKWMWLANTPGLLVSITARISISILLIRIFGVHEWFKWFVIVVTSLCSVLTAVILPCTYLQSTPVSGNWDPSPTDKHWNPDIYIDLAFIGQALWTFSDLTFVMIPVIILWRLNMPLGQRMGLIVLMSVSLFTMVMSILKTVGLQKIANQEADPTAVDVEYDATLEILWSILEQACVIIMGCVPPLRAIRKLKLAQTISSALSSLVRRNKSTQPSAGSSNHYNNNKDGGLYQDLEMHSDKLGRGLGNRRLPFMAVTTCDKASLGSQQDLVNDGNGIRQTNELHVSYYNQDRDAAV